VNKQEKQPGQGEEIFSPTITPSVYSSTRLSVPHSPGKVVPRI